MCTSDGWDSPAAGQLLDRQDSDAPILGWLTLKGNLRVVDPIGRSVEQHARRHPFDGRVVAVGLPSCPIGSRGVAD